MQEKQKVEKLPLCPKCFEKMRDAGINVEEFFGWEKCKCAHCRSSRYSLRGYYIQKIRPE